MTAPESTPGRVPGVTGWIGKHDDAYLICGPFRVEVFRTAGDVTTIGWGLYTAGARLAPAGRESDRAGESRRDAIIRVRILAEQALAAHLTEALAALRGTP